MALNTSAILNSARDAIGDASLKLAVAAFAQDKTGAKDVSLPNEELGIITEMLNRDNPLAAYTGVSISGQGSGSVEVRYDVYHDNWKKKTTGGSDATGGDDVVFEDEIFKWNKSLTKEEKVVEFDRKRGLPETLGNRMTVSSVKFMQDSIKKAFQAFADKAAKDASVAVVTADITSRDKLTQSKIEMMQKISTFIKSNELDPSDITITLEDGIFDAFAEQGMIGDRSAVTYSGGRYSVGTMGGYRVQSGGMYLPATATNGSATKDVTGFVGTSKVGLHSVDFIAANYGKLGLSNDLGTYLEMCDIFGALDYKTNFGKVQSMVLLAAALA